MCVEFINPFLESADRVLLQLTRLATSRGPLAAKMPTEPYPDICVVFGVVGKLKGQVIYGMEEETAKQIASRMLTRVPVEELDEMAKSALGELGNMITGQATMGLETTGYLCRISPPAIVRGTNITISSPVAQIFVVPLDTQAGRIDLHVGLEEAEDKGKR